MDTLSGSIPMASSGRLLHGIRLPSEVLPLAGSTSCLRSILSWQGWPMRLKTGTKEICYPPCLQPSQTRLLTQSDLATGRFEVVHRASFHRAALVIHRRLYVQATRCRGTGFLVGHDN